MDETVTDAPEASKATPASLRSGLAQAVQATMADNEAKALQAVAEEVFRVLYEAGIRVDMVELARFSDDEDDRSQDLYAGSNGLGQWAQRGSPSISFGWHLALCGA